MAQGWAGSQGFTPSSGLNCAPCAIDDRSVPAYTLINGTALCLNHAKQNPFNIAGLFKPGSGQ